ncbi:feruloyl-CoA synthase [soil metagenome]
MSEVGDTVDRKVAESSPIESEGFARPGIVVTHHDDGALTCESAVPLDESGPATMLDWLAHWAASTPARCLMAERSEAGWQQWTYAEAQRESMLLASRWLANGLQPGRALLVLASNSIAHARLVLAAQQAGIAVASINPRYASSDAGLAKLASIDALLNPQAVHLDGGAASSAACVALFDRPGIKRIAADGSIEGDSPIGPSAAPTASLATHPSVGADTIARIFFTSGSTGVSKAVPYTHRMMTSNVQMLLQVWPFITRDPLVMLDWLPWSHVFGGNNNLNLVLRTGGTLFIDGGAPTASGMATTLSNLEEVSPTFYCNVPAGYAALIDALERSPSLRAKFFSRLKAVFFAAAAMPVPLWQRLQSLAKAETGRNVPILSGWGATESGPSATLVQRADAGPGNIGTPLPGVSLKLKAVGNKLEAWIRSPSVAAGYLGNAETTRAAFDADGYFRSGDAVRFVDGSDPNAGFIYDGRIAEDFKLQSGTWVNAIAVRSALLTAGAGCITDVVLLGPNRPHLCALAWLSDDAATRPSTARDHLDGILQRYNAAVDGRSQRIVAVGVLSTAPNAEAGEINEKGYVNQNRARELRASDADALYAIAADTADTPEQAPDT